MNEKRQDLPAPALQALDGLQRMMLDEVLTRWTTDKQIEERQPPRIPRLKLLRPVAKKFDDEARQ